MVVKITSLRAKRRAENKFGSRPVAEFDFINDDLAMRRCTLVQLADGRFKTWAPTTYMKATRSAREAEATVYFRSGSGLHDAVTKAARNAYEALLGTP